MSNQTYVVEVRTNSVRNSSLILLTILGISFLAITLVYVNFPKLEPNQVEHFKLPWNIDDAKNLGTVLSAYKDRYFYTVLFGFIITYIFLQSFAIPGSIFLSVLSGYLFTFPLAIFAVCFCSAVGASVCYTLSMVCGRPIITKYWPERVQRLSTAINQHREHLLNYIIFLRITPFLPNWLINIASPIVNVPLKLFFVGTFLGVAPPSFVAIHAGTTLYQLSAQDTVVSFKTLLMLILVAVLSLVPIIAKRVFKDKFKQP